MHHRNTPVGPSRYEISFYILYWKNIKLQLRACRPLDTSSGKHYLTFNSTGLKVEPDPPFPNKRIGKIVFVLPLIISNFFLFQWGWLWYKLLRVFLVLTTIDAMLVQHSSFPQHPNIFCLVTLSSSPNIKHYEEANSPFLKSPENVSGQ